MRRLLIESTRRETDKRLVQVISVLMKARAALLLPKEPDRKNVDIFFIGQGKLLPNAIIHRLTLFNQKQMKNQVMEQFFCLLKDLTRGHDFGVKEASIVRYAFVFNTKNDDVKKYQRMETLSPSNALQFAIARDC